MSSTTKKPFSSQKEVQKPSLWLLLLESRAVVELGMYAINYPFLRAEQKGDGHPVMVIPGFMTDDITTIPLRHYLKKMGYAVHAWGLGRNMGNPEIDWRLIKRVKQLKSRYGKNVSLIGWSLGGVYAREIARIIPEDVRQVITLGSPFMKLTEKNNAIWLHEAIYGKKVNTINSELLRRMTEPLPVPTTAIFSKSDGIVPWEYCIEPFEDAVSQNIEVASSHCGLGHHPVTLICIADRLAQAENDWKPFKVEGAKKWMYEIS